MQAPLSWADLSAASASMHREEDWLVPRWLLAVARSQLLVVTGLKLIMLMVSHKQSVAAAVLAARADISPVNVTFCTNDTCVYKYDVCMWLPYCRAKAYQPHGLSRH